MDLIGVLFICIIIFAVGCLMGVLDDDILDLDFPIALCVVLFIIFVMVLCAIGLCSILAVESPFVVFIEIVIWIIGLFVGNAIDEGIFEELEFYEYIFFVFAISLVIAFLIFVLYAFSFA